MRKEIPLLITGFVGVILILQYFSPNKQINQVEGLFMNWMQIVAAFSMILGVLNLIRVNGDKIYKKRRNWGFSVIIIISLFATLFVGFSNIGSKSMYNRKILKTNSGIVGSVAKEVLKENGFKIQNEAYSPLLVALIEGTQKERTISSILPDKLKKMKLEDKYSKMLDTVLYRSKEAIARANNLGRDINVKIEESLDELKGKEFKDEILSLNKSIVDKLDKINAKLNLKKQENIEDTIYAQVEYNLKNINKKNIVLDNFTYYRNMNNFIKKLNEFLLNDEDLLVALNLKLRKSKSFNTFYKDVAAHISLKQSTKFEKILKDNFLPTYLNLIYREKNISKNTLNKVVAKVNNGLLASNEDTILDIVNYIKLQEINKIKNAFSQNKMAKNEVAKVLYLDMVEKLFNNEESSSASFVATMVKKHLSASLTLKKLKTNKSIVNKYIAKNKDIFKDLKLSSSSTRFILSTLLANEKYELATLDNGSSFMEIYRYIFTPLSSTMFALLAFFVASASYRAFRARNKEATILLIAGFLVMLGRVPVGQMFSIEGVFDVAEISQFIMEVPAMSVQSAIMIGVALGVISTSLRLILGIERSHLGGD